MTAVVPHIGKLDGGVVLTWGRAVGGMQVKVGRVSCYVEAAAG